MTRKLDIATPSTALVDAYLSEIAKGYGVPWSPPTPEGAESGKDDDDGSDGGVKVSMRIEGYTSTRCLTRLSLRARSAWDAV